jgi:hypothetical protein
MVGAVRFELTTTCTPCRYATRLRYAPKSRRIIAERICAPQAQGRLGAKKLQQLLKFLAQSWHHRNVGTRGREFLGRSGLIEPGARTADRESLLIEQFANATDQQNLVMLVITPVTAALHWFELRKFLLPVAQHMGLDSAKLAHFTDREVAFCGNWWQRSLTTAAVVVAAGLHRSSFRPSPSVFDWHET